MSDRKEFIAECKSVRRGSVLANGRGLHRRRETKLSPCLRQWDGGGLAHGRQHMIHMIGQALFGLVIGVVAKLLLPGRDPGGLIVTALIGMVGGWVGGRIGRLLGWYEEG